MIRFEIGGRRIAPDKIGDAMMAAVLNSMCGAHGVKPYILHLTEPVPGPKIIRSHVPLDV
jgi:hypothetical protein